MSLIETPKQTRPDPEAEARPGEAPPEFLIFSILRRGQDRLLKKPIFFVAGLVAGLPGAIVKAGQDPFLNILLADLADYFSFTLVYGGLALAAAQTMRGEAITLGPSLQRGLSRSLSVFFLAALIPFCLAACLVALIVPGLILACLWSVAIPACVIENRGPIGGINRSESLTKGSRLKIFALFIIIVPTEILLVRHLASPLTHWLWSQAGGADALLAYLAEPIVFAPLIAFNYLVISAIYTDLKAIEDSRADNRKFLEIFD